MTSVADELLTRVDLALDGYTERLGTPPPSLDDRLPDWEPTTDHERWIGERIICRFCHEDYKKSERSWVRIALPCRHTGKIICATCISDIGFTGCHWYQTSSTFGSYILTVFGQDEPPDDWEYERPGWREVAAAFEGGSDEFAAQRGVAA